MEESTRQYWKNQSIVDQYIFSDIRVSIHVYSLSPGLDIVKVSSTGISIWRRDLPNAKQTQKFFENIQEWICPMPNTHKSIWKNPRRNFTNKKHAQKYLKKSKMPNTRKSIWKLQERIVPTLNTRKSIWYKS